MELIAERQTREYRDQRFKKERFVFLSKIENEDKYQIKFFVRRGFILSLGFSKDNTIIEHTDYNVELIETAKQDMMEIRADEKERKHGTLQVLQNTIRDWKIASRFLSRRVYY